MSKIAGTSVSVVSQPHTSVAPSPKPKAGTVGPAAPDAALAQDTFASTVAPPPFAARTLDFPPDLFMGHRAALNVVNTLPSDDVLHASKTLDRVALAMNIADAAREHVRLAPRFKKFDAAGTLALQKAVSDLDARADALSTTLAEAKRPLGQDDRVKLNVAVAALSAATMFAEQVSTSGQ